MTCGTCPNCGLDLATLNAVHVGDLAVEDGGTLIRWKSQRVDLPPARRLLVSALAKAAGHVVKTPALYEALGINDHLDPTNLLKVQASRTRAAFRQLDPGFDQIETVWATGYRWRES